MLAKANFSLFTFHFSLFFRTFAADKSIKKLLRLEKYYDQQRTH